jgi:ribosomal protein L5
VPSNSNKQVLPALLAIELSTGRKAGIIRARKSIDKYDLRKGMPVGCRVTMRRRSDVYTLPDRLIYIVIPKSIQQGNYDLGYAQLNRSSDKEKPCYYSQRFQRSF